MSINVRGDQQMNPLNPDKVEQFSGTVLADLSSGMSGVLVQIGHELGLYRAMKDLGSFTANDLAQKTGTFMRYVQEWLNNQAAGGYVLFESKTKKYVFPTEHALVLADEDSSAYMVPGFNVVSSMWYDKDRIIDDFRKGKGIGWHEHHHNLFFGTEAFFRTGYRTNLAKEWIPSLDGMEEKLRVGGKVADIGFGHGASTIIMASHYPNSQFYGFDYHEDSIKIARERAIQAGLSNIHFEVASAHNYIGNNYDLVCFMDAFHDFGNPLEAIKFTKTKLSTQGSVMLVEPASFDDPEQNFNTVGRMFYAASTTLCVPHSHSQDGGICLGAQAGPSKVQDIALEAGFLSFKIVKRTPVNLVFEIKI